MKLKFFWIWFVIIHNADYWILWFINHLDGLIQWFQFFWAQIRLKYNKICSLIEILIILLKKIIYNIWNHFLCVFCPFCDSSCAIFTGEYVISASLTIKIFILIIIIILKYYSILKNLITSSRWNIINFSFNCHIDRFTWL